MAFGFTQSRDNSTGFTIQWGSSGASSGTLTFPRAFSSVLSLSFHQINTKNTGHSDWYLSTPYSLNSRNFSFYSYNFDGTVKYIAIGFSQSRDNSTGFTINWGVCAVAYRGNIQVWFSRAFSSCHSALATYRKADAHTGNQGTITINIESGSSMRIYQYDTGSSNGVYWVAFGFS